MQRSVAVRLLVMAFLLAALMIPLAMTSSLVGERTARRDEAVAEISKTWGGSQTVGAPVLVVPYRLRQAASGDQPAAVRTEYLVQLPELLAVTGRVSPEARRRGAFEAVVYEAALEFSGRFAPIDAAALGLDEADVVWDAAVVALGVTDPRGLSPDIRVTWAGASLPLVPGVPRRAPFDAGIQSAPGAVSLVPGAAVAFSASLAVKGTRDLRLLPLGDSTRLSLQGGWPHPGFVGAALPDSRRVDATGFEAGWDVAYFARGYPSAWIHSRVDAEQLPALVAASAFGVSLANPADVYQQAERAVKYAPLCIVLTLAVAFLWEVTRGRLVHPVQYLFVGFGLVLFYLLLISLAEHVRFDLAYVLAALASVGLIAWYWRWVLGGLGSGLAMGGALSLLHGYLFVLLRLEDYALLAGASGLFVMLTVVMYMTRRIDWFALRLPPPAQGDAP